METLRPCTIVPVPINLSEYAALTKHRWGPDHGTSVCRSRTKHTKIQWDRDEGWVSRIHPIIPKERFKCIFRRKSGEKYARENHDKVSLCVCSDMYFFPSKIIYYMHWNDTIFCKYILNEKISNNFAHNTLIIFLVWIIILYCTYGSLKYIFPVS